MPDYFGSGRIIAETERLILREMTENDFDALCRIMCDPQTMEAAYVTPFTPEDVHAWLGRHLKRYATLGFGLWAVVLKSDGPMIGQCGLTMQEWNGREILEVGYLFDKAFWHNGFATEAVRACTDYAFTKLNADAVYSVIRESHTASRAVALRNGMKVIDRGRKTFRNVDMDFLLFCIQRAQSMSE